MNTTPIFVTSEDHARLHLLVKSLLSRSKSANLLALHRELERAQVVSSHTISPAVVRLGSLVSIEDLDTNEVEQYTLCMPDRSNSETGMISVLAPIGSALLGFSEGDVIEWETPGGQRRLRLLKVQQPVLAGQP